MRKCVITHIFDVTVKVKDKVLFQKKQIKKSPEFLLEQKMYGKQFSS